MQNIRKICFRIYNNLEYLVLKIAGVNIKAKEETPPYSPREGRDLRPLLTPLMRGEILAGGMLVVYDSSPHEGRMGRVFCFAQLHAACYTKSGSYCGEN